ncbi:MAG: hypothetical protein AAF480_05970 [Actinomycetota bacterium]
MDLTGTWQAAPADEELRRNFHHVGFDDAAWESVDVPGHWTDHPAFRDETSMLFRRTFDHGLPEDDGGRSWLELDGVCYQGDVWLDGEYLGDTEGYFVRHAFDVTDALRDRNGHELAVEVNCSPGGAGSKRRSILGIYEGGNEMVPDGNPGGIWAPLRLRHTGPVRIHGVRAICVQADTDRAIVAIRAMLATSTARSVRLVTEIAGVTHEADHSVAVGLNEVEWRVTVPNPDLWWPHSLGPQPLYELTVRAETRTDEVSDQHGQQLGLRSVDVRRWQFSVNGERLFVKGVNIGPASRTLAETTDEDVVRQLRIAKDAGLDLVRPYAHVAPDVFYEHADQLGLLVWQDLPLHGQASNSLRGQAVRQARAMVDQLGHHPSIVTWNAHVSPAPEQMEAEVPTPGRAARRLAAHQLPTWSKSVLDRSIKNVFDSQDGSRNTSGFSGVLPHLPRLEGSATHLWFGWRRGTERELPDYAARWPAQVRFVAEFGAQSVPGNIGPADHEWSGSAIRAIETQPGYERASFARYVPPEGHESFGAWRDATQLYQAGLLRRQIETLRRLKYSPTGGFCIHQLADSVPVVSASLVDSDGAPKLAHQAVTEACRPVIVVADRLPPRLVPGTPIALDIHVVNDLRNRLRDAVVDAEISWAGSGHRWRFGGDVDPDTVARVGTLSWVVPDAAGLVTLTLRLSGPIDAVNRYDATIR